ncbi:MAG: hypothetical protein JRE43_06995 [Deltaproteobacteria bacterium]|jgi:hypothetical protein|nr:hypothetical protein [Deltaproteobacteria bacterium]MBW2543261.1 hypothetical protein [Deltaproteobacteria bacterium]
MPVDLFDFTAERLEQLTSLDRLAARGTLRLALKASGLSPTGLRVEQLRVVLEKVLPDELEKCGVDVAQGVCSEVSAALANLSVEDLTSGSTDTDEIFRRLGGS